MIKDILVAGAGVSEVNGIYRARAIDYTLGTFWYSNDAETFGIMFFNDCWTIIDWEWEDPYYREDAYTALPEDGTWIVADMGVLPVPTVTAIEPESGGGGAVSIQPISGRISL